MKGKGKSKVGLTKAQEKERSLAEVVKAARKLAPSITSACDYILSYAHDTRVIAERHETAKAELEAAGAKHRVAAFLAFVKLASLAGFGPDSKLDKAPFSKVALTLAGRTLDKQAQAGFNNRFGQLALCARHAAVNDKLVPVIQAELESRGINAAVDELRKASVLPPAKKRDTAAGAVTTTDSRPVWNMGDWKRDPLAYYTKILENARSFDVDAVEGKEYRSLLNTLINLGAEISKIASNVKAGVDKLAAIGRGDTPPITTVDPVTAPTPGRGPVPKRNGKPATPAPMGQA